MKQKYILLLTFFGILAGYNLVKGQVHVQKKAELIKASASWLPSDTDFCYLNYTENKGQWDSRVLYQSDFHGGRIFLEKNAFTYVFYPPDGFEHFHPHEGGTAADLNTMLTFQAIRMEFANSSNATVEPQTKREFYNNYFIGNDPAKWASQVRAFGKVYYHELYKGITAKVFSNNTDVRYDFIISPSADPSQIRLDFMGQNGLSIKDGKLIIKTEIGDIEEATPYAYQMAGGQKVKVDCKYVIDHDQVEFALGKYDPSLQLIIDPTLVFSTFTGSTSDNWGMSATYDAFGNGYTSGICFGVGYPTTLGTFQASYQGGGTGGGNWFGGFDIVVSKFDPNGATLKFSTYLGGSDNEWPSSLIVDNSNHLIVLGRSYSTNFPTTAGAFQAINKGGSDLIISKFDSNGTTLLASTYMGGTGDDGVNGSALESVLVDLKYNYADDDRGDVVVDNNNNIYVASCTNSADFPTTAGAYRTTPYGMQDGCVFEFNTSLTTLAWSTYIGGSNNDAAYNLALNSTGDVYVTGGTESNDFPVTAGVINPAYGGSIDGFLCHFSSNGTALINSTYIGTAGYDQSYFVQTDKYNRVYVYGQTSGAYPVISAAYSVAGGSQFIHCLNPALSTTIFSTTFGSGRNTPDISPSAFLVDDCENIYVAGWGGPLYGYNVITSSTSGMPVTANAFQPVTTGHDFYFMVLQNNASALWYATFFGGPNSLAHVDGGTSRFDKNGVIYQAICGGCGGYSDVPTTPGAWSNTNNSPNCNNVLVKFKMDLLHTVASFVIDPLVAAGCAPFSVTFQNTTNYGQTFQWYFGDGTSTNTPTPSHNYPTPGSYHVMLIATDSSTCNVTDTAYSIVRVVPPLTMNPIPNTFVCAGDSVNLNAVSPGAISFTWSPTAGVSYPNISNPKISPSASTEYFVIARDSFCSASDSLMVQVYTASVQISPNNPQLCIGDSVRLSSDSVDASYAWSTGRTSSSIEALTGGKYYLNVVDRHGCKAADTTMVQTFNRVLLQYSDTSICVGQTAQLQTTNGAYTYQWAPPADLSSATIYNPVASPAQTTTYTVSVTNGPCVSIDSSLVIVRPVPTLSVNTDSVMILYGESVTLTASGSPGWVWSPNRNLSCVNCQTTTATPDTNTIYYVTVFNAQGCKATDSVKIDILPTFFVPTAFTPNGDMINEVFRPKCSGYVTLDAYIFNRWGQLIYHWNSLDGGWDGKVGGQIAPEDVYVYSFTAVSYDNKTVHKIGNVTLLK
jgi:gliding motility-associated-like protein